MPTQLLAGESMVLPTIRKHWVVLAKSMSWPAVVALLLLIVSDSPLWDYVGGTRVGVGRGVSPVPLVVILIWLSVAGVVLSLIMVYMKLVGAARWLFWPSAGALVLLVIIVNGPLANLAGVVGGDARVVITVLALGIVGLAWWWAWFNWKAGMMTVTDQRVILEDGVVIKKSKVIPLDRVQDVSTTQNLLGRFLDYGSLEIDTAGAIPNELFTYAHHPEILRDQVFVLSEQLRRGI
jgi:membrane protein YdbS with pleckstrin-like domain